MQTVRDNDSIIYFWELPDFYTFKDDKTINIITSAINLNCKKNLQNMLIDAQLISDIDVVNLDIGIFILNIDVLPNINYKKAINIITDMVRNYFNNLKKFDWNKIYDYYSKSFELSYNNTIKENNMDLATNISINMHYYDEKYLYSGNKLVIKKDYNKLYEILKHLTFDKANIIYGTKKTLDKSKMKKEKYYGKLFTKLQKSRIPPTHNSYDFNIHIDNNILNINPKVIKNLDKYNKIRKLSPRFWYGGVSKFNEPMVLGHIIIYNKHFFNSPLSSLISQIAIGIINYKMQLLFCNEIDIGYRVYLSFNNIIGFISLNISGFNDKYVDFFNKVIDNIKIDASDVMIENDISLYKKELNNMDKESPWDISSHILQSMLHKYVYYYKDELKEINKITVDMIKQRINKIINLNKLSLTTIIYGNINYKELKNCNTYKMNIPLNNIIPKIHMPKNITLHHPNKDEVNCCISFIYPMMNNNNSLLSAKLIILSTLMGRPAFDELRTKAQLGYLVSCKLKIEKLSYIKLSVQSALDYKKVEELMNVFIDKQFIDILENIDEKTFNQTKKSIYDNLIEKDNNLAEMAYSYIDEITSQEYIFDREVRIAKKLKEVSLNDIIKLYHSIIKNKTIIRVI